MILNQAANVHHHGVGLKKGSGLLAGVTYTCEEIGLRLRMPSTVLDYFLKQSIPPSSPGEEMALKHEIRHGEFWKWELVCNLNFKTNGLRSPANDMNSWIIGLGPPSVMTKRAWLVE